MKSERLRHVRELDGLRGVAALMVLMHHLCYSTLDQAKLPTVGRLAGSLARHGYAGVEVFFVLSGFLITSLLLQDRGRCFEKGRERSAYYGDFYWKRALRILPVYVVCLLLTGLLVPGSGIYILLSMLFVANFAPAFHVLIAGPFWTLAIEEQFYLVWPTVVRKRTVEELQSWALWVVIVVNVLRMLASLTGHHQFAYTFFHCDGLAMGAYLACRYARGEAAQPGQSGLSWKLLATLLAMGVGTLVCAYLTPFGKIADGFAISFRSAGQVFLFGALVGFAVRYSGSRRTAVLRWRVLTFFGLISYALYMFNMLVLDAYDRWWGPLPAYDSKAYLVRFFLIVAGVVGVSLISRYAIELPAISLRKYVLRRPSPSAEIEQPLLTG